MNPFLLIPDPLALALGVTGLLRRLTVCGLAAGLAGLVALPAGAALTITRLAGAPSGPQVRISHSNYDAGGNTSIRHYPRLERDLK